MFYNSVGYKSCMGLTWLKSRCQQAGFLSGGSSRCWQNSVPCGWRVQVSISLFTVHHDAGEFCRWYCQVAQQTGKLVWVFFVCFLFWWTLLLGIQRPPLALSGLSPAFACSHIHLRTSNRVPSPSNAAVSLTTARKCSSPLRTHVIRWGPPASFRFSRHLRVLNLTHICKVLFAMYDDICPGSGDWDADIFAGRYSSAYHS